MKTSFSCLFFLSLLFITFRLSAQPDKIGNQFTPPPHPRILLKAGEEARIQQTINADATWKKLHRAILAECDAIISVPPIERIQIGRRLLDKSREALRRIFQLSYAYRMTGDLKYLQRGEKEMLKISGFTDWNPSHFLDVAEMTMAMSIGYDWLYKGLSAKSRSAIKEAILRKGLEPSMDSKNNSWLTVTHNWNQVCNAGMSYGAMSIYEDQPDLARKIINRALESIQLPMGDYAPDGAYPEGYGYWGYGTSFNVMFVSAIEKLFGQDFGLSAKPGFLKTAGYLENMTGPSGTSFNYSDAGAGGDLQPAMFWFALENNDPSLLWVERSRLLTGDMQRFTRNRLLPSLMIWSNGVGIDKMSEPKSLMWVGRGKNPVALMRTSWSDSLAIYLGFKAGSASVNHAHMDIGSFIMEADGVRWAMDFGMQDYESLESKGIQVFGRTQDAERWNIFRYNNLVHNTLTFDNKYQQVEGYAPLAGTSASPAFMSAKADLSAEYKGQVAKANRGVAIVNKAYVVVRDEVQTNALGTNLRWTMLTPADVKITSKNTAELSKNGKHLTLTVTEPAQINMKTWSTTPPHSYDAPNPGTALVGFEVTLPANARTNVVVTLVPDREKGVAVKPVTALDSWKDK